jgi:hypothetical protein
MGTPTEVEKIPGGIYIFLKKIKGEDNLQYKRAVSL